ncbi:MAG: hypothetical protein ACT4QD_21750 [Acidobacteriota bacterium]
MAVGSAIIAAPITYEIDQTQYVAVMAGAGRRTGRHQPDGPAVIPGRLRVFGLGGKRNIPSLTGSARLAPTPIAVTASADEVTSGAATYARR